MGLVTQLFTHISNPVAMLSCLVVGVIAPAIGAALIGVGGGLLKGLFGGMGRKAEDKRKWELFMKRMQMIKPKGRYSRGIDPVTEQAIMNMFASRGMAVPQFGGGISERIIRRGKGGT